MAPKKNFQDIHQMYKSDKFQHDWAIFWLFCPKVLEEKGYKGPKNEDFEKIK